MPYFFAYSYTPESSPPLHVPQSVLSLPHESTFCTESMSCGMYMAPVAFVFIEAMFMRSASAEVEPMAQQEPQ